MRKMESNLSEYDLINILEGSEIDYKDDLLKLLKCASCKKLMIEPLFCPKCNLYICSKCNVNCKNIKAQTPRHLKDFLDKIKLKCKNKEKGCQKILNFSETFSHLSNCEFNVNNNNFISDIEIDGNFNNKNNHIDFESFAQNSFSNNNKIQSNLIDNSNRSIFFFNINQNDKNDFYQTNKNAYDNKSSNDLKIVCFTCNDGRGFNTIDDLIQHRNSNSCKSNKNDDQNEQINYGKTQNNNSNSNNINYREEYETHINNCLNSLKDTQQNNFEILNKFFFNYQKEYYDRNQKIETLAQIEKSLKNNKSNPSEKNLALSEKHPEIIELMEEKRALLRKKSTLEFELMKKLNELNKLYSSNKINKNSNSPKNNKDEINIENKSNLFEDSKALCSSKIEELNSMEQKLIKLIDELQPGLIPSINTCNLNVCFKCKNENAQIKKIVCEECKVAFCENKCIKLCAGEICEKNKKFVCPKHNNECSLCLRHVYCNFCLKKCYYNNCKNFYCPPCYRRNEHQTRNPTISCKFFTCERDNFNDCILSSLFCQTCEKRICKNCIQNEKQHFPFLK